MPKKRDYTSFIQFAKEHQDKLTSEGIYKAYQKYMHEQGGKGLKKQTAHNLMRELFGYDKGEKKGQTVKQKYNQRKAHEPTPSKPTIKSIPKTNHYITLDKRNSKKYDIQSPVVKKLKDKIDNMFGYSGNTYIQIDVTINNDGYTKHNKFSVWLPFTGRSTRGKVKRDTRATGEKILQNLKTFYSNLAKQYGKTPMKNAKNKLKKDMLSTIGKIENELSNSPPLSKEDLELLFAKEGIHLDNFGLLQFTKNERIEGSQRYNKEHGLKGKAKDLNR